MLTLSCGILLFNEHCELFLAHATGSQHWDIPKGMADPGESAIAAALRETLEETGLVFSEDELFDLGVNAYRADKRLHLFAAHRPSECVSLQDCRCTSMFEQAHTGKLLPEADAFRWIPITDVSLYCSKNMTRLLTTGLDLPHIFNRVASSPKNDTSGEPAGKPAGKSCRG